MLNQFLHKLLEEEIQDLYSAEKQITQAQPMLIDKATSTELKSALEKHLDKTNEQIIKLEEIARRLDIPLDDKRCIGMEGIISEAEEDLSGIKNKIETDLTIIALTQRIEHFEIASLGTARNYAQKMAHRDEAQLLDEIAKEEGKTDKKLTSMAEHIISKQASRSSISYKENTNFN